jgi:hypothetical protein
MILARPPSVFNPWNVGAERFNEAFLWIGAVAAAIFGLLLLVSYFNNHKKHILMWSFAFLGIWIYYHQLIAGGSWAFMIDMLGPVASFRSTGMWTMLAMALGLLIPALIASGLAYDKDKKFGAIFTLYSVLMTMLYVVFMVLPNSNIFGDGNESTPVLIGFIIEILVQLPSAVLIIALPIMKEGPLFPKTMVSVAGVVMLTQNILLSIIGIMANVGAPLSLAEGGSTVQMVNLVPFAFLIIIVCLLYGLISNKDYGFSLPNVEFEE